MFKTLASLFKSQASEEGAKVELDEVDANAEDVDSEEETDAEGDDADADEITADETDGAEVGISTERYNALLAAETELRQFGATADDRQRFLAETEQLFAWYNNVKNIGIKGIAQDANQEQKGKVTRKSAVTKEAEELAKKRK